MKEPTFQKVVDAIIMVESSGGINEVRFEKGYRWIYEPEDIAAELGLELEAEVAQQRSSYGSMQVMGAVARELGCREKDLEVLHGVLGLHYGVKFLKQLKHRFPTFPDYIAAYNAGTPKEGPDGRYVNQDYVDKVLRHI